MTLKNENNHHPHAHFIVIAAVRQSLLFKNEEKLVALLFYSSFKGVATSGFRIIPYSLVMVCLNEEWIRNHSVFTTARHSQYNRNGVIRLVATEHVRNRYSFQESIVFKSVKLLVTSIYLQSQFKLHLLQ